VPTGASVGVAVSTAGQSAAEVLRNADTAMYAAKGRGKHCVALYEPALHEAAIHRYNLTFELNRAITEGEFVVHYQPIVHLADRYVAGAEALVRWQHPTLGLLSPVAFVAIAEESDAIVRIGRSVLEQVCQFLSERPLPGHDATPFYVAVNLSARDLLEPTLAADLATITSSYRIDPAALVFEVTEGLMITDPTAAIRSLTSLKDRGARIALDDFGTGYSSLSYLRRLPVDILKIAQPFVDDLATPAGDASFVEAIVRLGQTLGHTIVAEGIEHDVQAEILTLLGCQYGQGYHFSRPVPVSELLVAIEALDTGRTDVNRAQPPGS
jgi:EAL domain-containing protein (putative c-di-GMP-specific phosphodiesterase class I)